MSKPIDWDIIAPPRPRLEELPQWAQDALAAEAQESDDDYLRRLYREQN